MTEERLFLTHAVLLNKHPYYILSHNEESAVESCKTYGESALGIIVAPEGLSMKTIQTKIVLEDIQMKQIPVFRESGKDTYEEVPRVDISELDDEERDILDITKNVGEFHD